ncbi:MAG: hypothetical protein ABJB49_10075 [Nitrospirota bacterium]
MSRRRSIPPREAAADPRFHDKLIGKFVNSMMRKGKKSTAERICYGAFEAIRARTFFVLHAFQLGYVDERGDSSGDFSVGIFQRRKVDQHRQARAVGSLDEYFYVARGLAGAQYFNYRTSCVR